MIEGMIAMVLLSGLALWGILDLIERCFGQARELEDEIAAARARMQERIRGVIYDAARLDDPLVKYELETLLREYRRG